METEGNVCLPFGVMAITIKLSFETSNFVRRQIRNTHIQVLRVIRFTSQHLQRDDAHFVVTIHTSCSQDES
jgi:hypothetical protein